MRILFDLTALYDHLTGIERYAMNISYNMIIAHPEHVYVLLFKNEVHKRFIDVSNQKNVEAKVMKGCNKLWFAQISLTKCLYQTPADAYIFLAFTSPLLFKKKRIINTIHDLTPWDCPQSMKSHMIPYGKILIRNACKASKCLVSVSEFSKRRISETLNVDLSKITVAYNGLSEQFLSVITEGTERIKDKYNLPEKYILCLSTLEPRKNMRLLIIAYMNLIRKKMIDADLVLAGRKGWKLDEILEDTDSSFERIHITGFIEDEDLPVLYRNALLFVFPSVYEGFGIPLIEAMSQGTLVISSDSSSLPEVAGEAAIFFKSNSIESLEEKIIQGLSLGTEERENYKKKGIKQAHRYRWENSSEIYYNTIFKTAEESR